MKHNKHVTCRCSMVTTKDGKSFPHRFDPKRCAVYDELARTEADDMADDPRRGQADAANRMEAIYRSGRGQR